MKVLPPQMMEEAGFSGIPKYLDVDIAQVRNWGDMRQGRDTWKQQ